MIAVGRDGADFCCIAAGAGVGLAAGMEAVGRIGHSPIAPVVAQRLLLIGLVGMAADLTGMEGISALGAVGRNHLSLIHI